MEKIPCPFRGCATALVTPFKGGEVDYGALGSLIDFQIDKGIDAIVVLGTTGEAPTISEDERYKIIEFSKRKINGRVPLIVGTGTNSTQSTVRYSKNAHSLGANALLCVSPYYNKPSEGGLINHYSELASSVSLPIILYNVPSRTGVNISLNVYKALSSFKNIVGIKEASGNISYLEDIICNLKDRYYIYTGNDDLAFVTLALGGKGVISVASNALPDKMHELCMRFFEGESQKSREIQLELLPLIRELFKETNPIPVKCALEILGLIDGEIRPPLYPSQRKRELSNILKSL